MVHEAERIDSSTAEELIERHAGQVMEGYRAIFASVGAEFSALAIVAVAADGKGGVMLLGEKSSEVLDAIASALPMFAELEMEPFHPRPVQ